MTYIKRKIRRIFCWYIWSGCGTVLIDNIKFKRTVEINFLYPHHSACACFLVGGNFSAMFKINFFYNGTENISMSHNFTATTLVHPSYILGSTFSGYIRKLEECIKPKKWNKTTYSRIIYWFFMSEIFPRYTYSLTRIKLIPW